MPMETMQDAADRKDGSQDSEFSSQKPESKTRFERIIGQMLDVHRAKNHDYSREGQFGNFKESEKVGVPDWKGAFVRLQDKYTRACNLIARDGKAMVADEKLEDTLLDLANYAVIVLCLLQETQGATSACRGKPGNPGKLGIHEQCECLKKARIPDPDSFEGFLKAMQSLGKWQVVLEDR